MYSWNGRPAVWRTAIAHLRGQLPSSPAVAPTAVRCRPIHGVLLAAGLACAPRPQTPPASLIVTQDHAEIRGVVRDNVTGCDVDGPCYLVLETSGTPVHVEYHHGEAPRCDNAEASRAGQAVKPGDTVTARGLYTLTRDFHYIDVCCAECALAVSTP